MRTHKAYSNDAIISRVLVEFIRPTNAPRAVCPL